MAVISFTADGDEALVKTCFVVPAKQAKAVIQIKLTRIDISPATTGRLKK